MLEYKKRVADEILKRMLEGKGAVLIEGPKWCGKTTTAEQQACSILYADNPENINENILMSNINVKKLLKGNKPRLIDEWQIIPKVWDAIRFDIDHSGELGQFILTGSAVPIESQDIIHTGTGRFAWLTMRTMSLYESQESSGEVSLADLFNTKKDIEGTSQLDLERLAFITCRGGWPQSIGMCDTIAIDQAKYYYDAIVRTDINRASGIKINQEKVRKFMQSYARNQGSQVSNESLARDVIGSNEKTISSDSVAIYSDALKKIFVIEEMTARNPNLRSKTAIRTSNTRYYSDPSIAAAALGIGPNDLMNDLNTFGLLFETLCIRDLRVYANALDGDVYHYRDKSGLECDAVIHLRNGKYGLVEIKLGGEKLIEEGVKNLKLLEGKIDTQKMNKPSFLMVLTRVGDYAYRRKDGVYVVPIGSLKD